MEKSNELVTELQHGDYERIAEITDYSKVYVRQVIHGTRQNERIINAANDYLKMRDELKKKYCNPVPIQSVEPTVSK